MKMEFSAGGVVYRRTDGGFKIALIIDTNDQWTFPKGHIEKGEKPVMAAVREIEEEIGLSQLQAGDLLEKSDYWFKFNDETIHKYVYFFLVEATSNEELVPQISEIKAAKWFSPEEALDIIGYKEQNQRILANAYEKLSITCDNTPDNLKCK